MPSRLANFKAGTISASPVMVITWVGEGVGANVRITFSATILP